MNSVYASPAGGSLRKITPNQGFPAHVELKRGHQTAVPSISRSLSERVVGDQQVQGSLSSGVSLGSPSPSPASGPATRMNSKAAPIPLIQPQSQWPRDTSSMAVGPQSSPKSSIQRAHSPYSSSPFGSSRIPQPSEVPKNSLASVSKQIPSISQAVAQAGGRSPELSVASSHYSPAGSVHLPPHSSSSLQHPSLHLAHLPPRGSPSGSPLGSPKSSGRVFQMPLPNEVQRMASSSSRPAGVQRSVSPVGVEISSLPMRSNAAKPPEAPTQQEANQSVAQDRARSQQYISVNSLKTSPFSASRSGSLRGGETQNQQVMFRYELPQRGGATQNQQAPPQQSEEGLDRVSSMGATPHLPSLLKPLDQLDSEKRHLEEANNHLKKALEAQASSANSMQLEMNSLKATNEHLQAITNVLQDEKDKLRKDLDKSRADAHQFTRQTSEGVQKLLEKNKSPASDDFEVVVQVLRRDLAQACEEKAELAKSLRLALDDKERLQKDLKTAAEDRNDLRQALEVITGDLIELKKEKEKLERDLTFSAEQQGKLYEDVRQLQEENSEMQNNIASLTSHGYEDDIHKGSARNDVSNMLRVQCKRYERELHKSALERNEAVEQLDGVKEQLADARKQVTALTERIDFLEDGMPHLKVAKQVEKQVEKQKQEMGEKLDNWLTMLHEANSAANSAANSRANSVADSPANSPTNRSQMSGRSWF